MDPVHAIKLLALEAVKKETADYNIRVVLRWYSKTFHTPLPIVEKMPIYEVLQHYFEEMYAGMEPDKLHEELIELTETDEERRERLRLEAADEARGDQFYKKLVDAAKAANAAKEAAQEIKKQIQQAVVNKDELQPVTMKFDVDEESTDEDREKAWDLFKRTKG